MSDRGALPPDDRLAIVFAHAAYRLKDAFDAGGSGIAAAEVRSREGLAERIGEADVVVASGLWSNDLLARAPRLRFVQSVSAGVDNFDAAAFRERGVRLASARGVNAEAVAQHAMALILALARRLHEARDDQARRVWRPMQGDPALRQDELTGRTLLVVGLGGVGGRLAELAKAFGMRVVGLRRDVAAGAGAADAVRPMAALRDLLPEADVVALTCPLTPDTRGLLDAAAFRLCKPGAAIVNVARGACLVEADLAAALREGRIAAAALDVFEAEPLSEGSPLWAMPNVLVTPHAAGETRRYEANVVALLADNLRRLRAGEPLRNAVA